MLSCTIVILNASTLLILYSYLLAHRILLELYFYVLVLYLCFTYIYSYMKEYVLCSPPPAEMLRRDSCRQEAWEWEGEEEEEEGEEKEEEEYMHDAEADGGGAVGAPVAWHKERVLSRGARSHAARCHDEQLFSSLANRISILEQEKNAICEKLKVFFLSG